MDICEYLQQELKKSWVEIQIDLMPTATLRQAKSSGKLEAFRASWIADYPDAENYLSLFLLANFSPTGPNYTHFYSKKNFDSLYTHALTFSTHEKRVLNYRTMDDLIMDNYPVIPPVLRSGIRFVQNDVKGIKNESTQFIVLKKVYKDRP